MPVAWQTPKGSLIAQFRKLDRFHKVELVFTDAAIREIARIALERGTEARGLRPGIEEVLERVLFEVASGVRCVVTGTTVRGEETVRRNVAKTSPPLEAHVLRR